MFVRLLRRFALWRASSLRRCFVRQLPGGPMSTEEIGALGERLAARWLAAHGRKVLARNFAAPEGGEVDIVCRHGDTLTFVEVKTRTRSGIHRPADAVTQDKQRLIQRGARTWLSLLGRPSISIRFDIAEIMLTEGLPPEVNVVVNAFVLREGDWLGRG